MIIFMRGGFLIFCLVLLMPVTSIADDAVTNNLYIDNPPTYTDTIFPNLSINPKEELNKSPNQPHHNLPADKPTPEEDMPLPDLDMYQSQGEAVQTTAPFPSETSPSPAFAPRNTPF